ncbi:glutamyl-tRNA(Gln) and/or aspartyl-tRNA(Asn) amidotransferase, A subunit [Desulfomonile tiedjei DSM 6799]|uniref:Glutamyl-tRNA(Gln) amidotransferase subunit A n=2 Tax=Desulfomonile tiedjei TaxID=2358 RepID=I4C7R9_DESTA|nr:Asp-tRNA(Asn)/Glu-tRNA(Gln) amidotransferase subunit GatA [Desulfomonile tiedjei]AFM25610.1 glutamyl-tRNA(Gln) and/or aspartyl-tRNA(Asn) amidotransferase, A subunit [Desulfomonile tiedjei DSM 6799]
MPELHDMTASELARVLISGETTSVEITRSLLARIDKLEESIHAYVTVDPDSALEMAAEADRMIAAGKAGPLTGIPIAVKDNMCIKGRKTSCGSRILGNFKPPYDATVVRRLKDAGMVILGSANMDEFAMGSSTETSYWGPTRNPWNTEMIPGGSSGGSAAAVAAKEAVVSLGSDTGGSIRLPAAFCGVTGIKPTYGAVSRFGLVAYASSLDQIGPIARDVKDIALLLNLLCGHDPMDSTSVPREYPDFTSFLEKPVKGMTLGLPTEFFSKLDNEDVSRAVADARKTFEDLGIKFVDLSLPHLDYGIAAYYIIAPSEASSNLARYDGVKYGHRAEEYSGIIDMYCNTRAEGFGPEVKRRIMLGTYALSSGYYDAYYVKAAKVRTLITNDFKKAFESCDAIFCPTAPSPAFRIGEKIDDPMQMYLTDVFTIPVNMAGLPGMAIPAGFSRDGLPIGLQLIAPHFKEEVLVQLSAAFQRETDHHLKTPAL